MCDLLLYNTHSLLLCKPTHHLFTKQLPNYGTNIIYFHTKQNGHPSKPPVVTRSCADRFQSFGLERQSAAGHVLGILARVGDVIESPSFPAVVQPGPAVYADEVTLTVVRGPEESVFLRAQTFRLRRTRETEICCKKIRKIAGDAPN